MKLLLILPLLLILVVPLAYADTTINTVLGSGSPGCEETLQGCYTPFVASVSVGEKIIFSNTDTAAHTFTSGNPDTGSDGLFDTGLLMAGASFEYTVESNHDIEYFCMVHPWMIGSIIVDGESFEEIIIPESFEILQDDSQVQMLQDKITQLELENTQLKSQIKSLEEKIVSMAVDFSNSIINLNEWFREQLK